MYVYISSGVIVFCLALILDSLEDWGSASAERDTQEITFVSSQQAQPVTGLLLKPFYKTKKIVNHPVALHRKASRRLRAEPIIFTIQLY